MFFKHLFDTEGEERVKDGTCHHPYLPSISMISDL
jgi:hypothetical protein